MKGKSMKRIWKKLASYFMIAAVTIIPSMGMAADFELNWDPNCNADTTLEGYFVYYKQEASVYDDPGGAIDLYIDLTDVDFDPDNPSLLIPDLLDDVRYCFAVTAWYGDEESNMSNEVCAINRLDVSDSDSGPGIDSDPDPQSDTVSATDPSPGLNADAVDASGGGSSSAGCFIGSLR
jgi:hypothetical protein